MKTSDSVYSETIEIIEPTLTPGARWTPTIGQETLSLLDHLDLPEPSRSNLQREASAVLSKCVPPSGLELQETGLVIGYVQSGKTMSFTTVAALARDNRFGIVIVLTGVTTNLFEQSKDRLESDLRTNDDRRRWLPFANPRDQPEVCQSIENALDAFQRDGNSRTVLLTVMKNGAHLEQLRRLLTRLPLENVPTLVVDDEADQASLNNEVSTGGESATYRRLLAIRSLLPRHTFLQYTATPQAPLLINLIDVLSPQFAEVLTPGSAYTGGETFFGGELDLVCSIAPSDIPSNANPLSEPPDSLLSALRLFFLGVAAGRLEDLHIEGDNRSMMIHPSMRTALQAEYE